MSNRPSDSGGTIMVERVGLGGHESAPQTPGHYAHDDSASPQGDTEQIRLMHGSGLASRAGGAHVTPTPRQDGRRTWGDVTYLQVAGYFCATMDELGRTAGERSRRLRVRARTSSPARPPGGPSATRGSATAASRRGECAPPPCSPVPTCPCAPRSKDRGLPWRPLDDERGDRCVARRPKRPWEVRSDQRID